MGPAHHPCSLRAPGKSQGREFHPKVGFLEAGVLGELQAHGQAGRAP